MTKKILLLAGLVIILAAFGIWWLNSLGNEWRCLTENEEAGFYDKLDRFRTSGIPKKYPLKVIVRNKEAKEEMNSFIIENIFENYHPVEAHKCGVYVVRLFNYDPKKAKQNIGYKSEFWKYDYSGKGKSLILLSEKPKEYISYYGPDFRIDPLERYIILEKGHSGKEYYALVVKDLETNEDVFTLSHREMSENFPKQLGVFDPKEWTQDGRYFWGGISNAALVPAYFRIDTEKWTYEIFDVPENQMGGDKLNVETGWVTNHTGAFWTGEYSSSMAIEAKMRSQGIGTKFYLYNLLTKEKILVYETDEPNSFTKPRWLSEKEIEYELPSGEKRVYELE